jgi:hypothetical protein
MGLKYLNFKDCAKQKKKFPRLGMELIQMLTDKVQPYLLQTGGFCNSAKILKRELEDSQSLVLLTAKYSYSRNQLGFTINISSEGKECFHTTKVGKI